MPTRDEVKADAKKLLAELFSRFENDHYVEIVCLAFLPNGEYEYSQAGLGVTLPIHIIGALEYEKFRQVLWAQEKYTAKYKKQALTAAVTKKEVGN